MLARYFSSVLLRRSHEDVISSDECTNEKKKETDVIITLEHSQPIEQNTDGNEWQMVERLRPTNLASSLFLSSSEHLRIERKEGNNAFVNKKEMRTDSLPCDLVAVSIGSQTHVRGSRDMNAIHRTEQQATMRTSATWSFPLCRLLSPQSILIIGTTVKTTQANSPVNAASAWWMKSVRLARASRTRCKHARRRTMCQWSILTNNSHTNANDYLSFDNLLEKFAWRRAERDS